MRRFLRFAIVLASINLLCQAGLTLVTRVIDLSFGAFAALLLIPLFQSALVVLASPQEDGSVAESWMRSLSRDRVSAGLAAATIVVMTALLMADDPNNWRWALFAILVSGVIALAVSARQTKQRSADLGPPTTNHSRPAVLGPRPTAFVLAALMAAFLATDIRVGFLERLASGFADTPTIIVLASIYVPLFVVTLLVLLALESAMRQRCAAAARMVEIAIALVLAGSLAVAGNYFHQPMIAEDWLPLVRSTELLAAAGVVVGALLYLRHDRGRHVDVP